MFANQQNKTQKHQFKGRKKKTHKKGKKDKGGKKSSSESCHKLDKHDCVSMWATCKYVNGKCVDSNEHTI